MAIESAADRAAFFDPDEFGSEITWLQDDVAVATLYGLLQRPSLRDAFGGGGEVIRETSLTCREADLPSGAARGDVISSDAGDFTVQTIEPDGAGMVVLMLSAAP